jgi:hypothetical protein
LTFWRDSICNGEDERPSERAMVHLLSTGSENELKCEDALIVEQSFY